MTIETENGWTFAESTKAVFRRHMEAATGRPVTPNQAEKMLRSLADYAELRVRGSGVIEAAVRNSQAREDLSIAVLERINARHPF